MLVNISAHTASQGELTEFWRAAGKNLYDLSGFWLYDFLNFVQKYAPMLSKMTKILK